MSKKFRNIIVLFLLLFLITFGVIKFNDNINLITSNINNSNIEVSNEKNNSNPNKDNNLKDNKNNDNVPNITVDDKYNNTQNSNTIEKDTNSSKLNNNTYSDDYTVAISSDTYNALVILDKDNKEINIKLIDEKTSNITSSDRYINFTDDEIKYLMSNSNDLLNEFKGSNIFEKYSMVSKVLSEFDTNIKESDLIDLAISYLK